MNVFNITIYENPEDGVDVTRYAVYPFNFQFTLDVGLDQAFVELRNTTRTSAYPAFSLVEITIDATESISYYISVDNCIVNQKTGRADHKILLIEETKILERVICRAKSFVKPLVKSYDENIQSMPYVLDHPDTITMLEDSSIDVSVKNIRAAYTSNTYIPALACDLYLYQNIQSDLNPNYPNPSQAAYNFKSLIPKSGGGNDLYRFIDGYIRLVDTLTGNVINKIEYGLGGSTMSRLTLDDFGNNINSGTYSLEYYMHLGKIDGATSYSEEYYFGATYTIAIYYSSLENQNLYITDTVEKLLQIAEPIRTNNTDTQRFTFDPGAAEKYEYTPCAEFNFANGATLWENLLEIARTVQCIPRLKNNVVYFDDLGSAEMLTEGVFGTPISQTSDITSEKFASHLDSVVNGLMNLENEEQGSMSDPFDNGFRTIRSETSVTDMRTSADTAMIATVANIEKITKVTVSYNGTKKDITPYIYEKKEYDLLYSNQGSYPYAKAYALYYVQGQPNIYGLHYREDDPVSPIFSNRAIYNILAAVGIEIPNIKQDVFDLSFNVEYITAINGRVRQAKRNVADLQTHSVIAFNQSANKLSSVNYGKRLKGEIAMMGSAETKLVFKTKGNAEKWAAIKTAAGKIFPDESYGKNMYISSVTAKMWRDYFLVELGLTKNFNQLGRFVGINSAVRQFEIDTNVSESYMVWEDYAVIGSAPFSGDTPLARPAVADSIAYTLLNAETSLNKVTLAEVTTYDYSGAEIGTYLLPVQSIALGNSLLFNFRFEDNYSAGTYLQDIGKDYKLTRLARYGDPIYGEAKTMSVKLYSNTRITDSSDVIPIGDSIPLDTQVDEISKFVTVLTGNPIIIHKSSRDAINFTYQLHFVTTDDYIFGNFIENNPLVGGHLSENGASCYFYNARLNVMDGTTPGGQYAEILPVSYDATNGAIFVDVGTNGSKLPNADYVSWCIRDKVTWATILGGNGKLPSDGRIYIRTTHKIN